MIVDLTDGIVDAGQWGADHEPQIGYSQWWNFRTAWLKRPKWQLPMKADCSAFVSWCHWVVDAPNPGGGDWSKIQDTEGLAANGTEIFHRSELRRANLCILGLDGPHPKQHVVMIVDVSNYLNPLVVSHGREAGPVIQRLNNDPRSKRFFRYDTTITVPDSPEEIEMEFIAQGPVSTASFLYDTQTMTRRGIPDPSDVTAFVAVGIKNYGGTLSKSFRSKFIAKENI